MVMYRCVWCGETTQRETDREAPQCSRCIAEFQLAFGFPLRTLMVPVEDDEGDRPPGAARKTFTFYDPEGREIWTTWPASPDAGYPT